MLLVNSPVSTEDTFLPRVKPSLFIVASGSFLPKVIIPLMPRASQHGPLHPPALKTFLESNFNFKGFHEVSRMLAPAGTVRGTNGIIAFGEKDPEKTITLFWLGGICPPQAVF